LEPTKLFIQLGKLNKGMPLGMIEEVCLPSGHKGPIELTNRYAKLATRMDTLTREVDMMGSNHIMNGVDKLMGKVNLMKVSESEGVDNSLYKGTSTCLKNQTKRII
jgi:hypothetical protein